MYADELLSTILGIREGDLVSYAELSKGLHQYIKANQLNLAKKPPAIPPVDDLGDVRKAAIPRSDLMKLCRDCGAEIPSEAVYCDLCGVNQ